MTIAAQTHITETLRSIPKDARMIYEYHAFASRSIPIGSIAKEALAHIDAQQEEIDRLTSESDERLKNSIALVMEIERMKAQQERKPAWHDAPTCTGVWMCDEGEGNCYDWRACRIEWLDDPELKEDGCRWYGPIPPDKETS